MTTLIFLVENSQRELKSAKVEHGLSVLIQSDNKNILFDTGSSGVFQTNAMIMDINLDFLDCVVCSHSHYDHAGGFRNLVANHKIIKLITGPDFFATKYAWNGKKFTYLGAGFSEDFLLKNNIQHVVCSDTIALTKEVHIVSHFARTNLSACPVLGQLF